MAAGKTIDFSTSLLKYYASGEALPTISNGLYVALLSGVPAEAISDPNAGPFSGLELSAFEVSSNYRADLGATTLAGIVEDGTTKSMKITNAAAEVNFSTAPASFPVSGYALCLNASNKSSGSYVAYELFVGADASKARSVTVGDTIKINVDGLTIREK